METACTELSIRGNVVKIPCLIIDQTTIVKSSGWLKIASVKEEDYTESPPISNPDLIVSGLKNSRFGADVFTFTQSILDATPKFSQYHLELDNVAAIPLTTYPAWWSGLSQESRRNVRIAEKRGVKIQVVPFDDNFVRGIKGIYDETPLRQGRKFWHYDKQFDKVKSENATFPERSEFIAAYLGDELIGFIKIVYVGNIASIMQILSKNAHFDKRPANAMIAKAVEVCCQKNKSHLVYCKYLYGNKLNSSITEFKRRNSFVKIDFPRYYIPLTLKGRIALKLGLHQGIHNLLPSGFKDFILNLRTKYYEKTIVQQSAAQPLNH